MKKFTKDEIEKDVTVVETAYNAVSNQKSTEVEFHVKTNQEVTEASGSKSVNLTKSEINDNKVENTAKSETNNDRIKKQAEPGEDNSKLEEQTESGEDDGKSEKQAEPEGDNNELEKQAESVEDNNKLEEQTEPKEDDGKSEKQTEPQADNSKAVEVKESETNDNKASGTEDEPSADKTLIEGKQEETKREEEEKKEREEQKQEENTDGNSDKVQKCDEVQKEDIEEKTDIRKKKRHKKVRIAAAVLLMALIGAIVFLYGRGVYYYKSNFFPQLEVNGVNCGNLTLQEAADRVQRWYEENYSLRLLDREGEELAVVLPSDIQMVFPVEEELSRILEGQNVYKWFLFVFSEEKDKREIVILPQYDMAKLEELLEQSGLFDDSCGEAPQDAYISEYQEEEKQFVIVPEREGTLLEREITVACAAEALAGMQDSLDLYETGCFKMAEITADNEQLKRRLEELNKVAGACITYDWNGTQEILDGELIHQWMVLDGEEITLDEEQVAAYVAQMAKEHDTYGKKRKFVTTSGLTLTLPSGAYGWKTDRNAETEALIGLILEGAVTEREPIYTSQGWAKGTDDIGDSYVEINLTDQHLYLYIDGELILETDFVSGDVANGNSTPAGVFGLTYKTRNAVLRGPDYETPVNYWMPFNGNIGMHDATWRRSFGGDIYLTNGSHGCINLPLKMAKTIYEYMSAGFPVICYYY